MPGSRGVEGPQGEPGLPGVVANIHVIHHLAYEKLKQQEPHALAQIARKDDGIQSSADIEMRLAHLTHKMDALKRLMERRMQRTSQR